MKIKIFKSIAVIMLMSVVALMQFGCEQDWQKAFEPSEMGAPTSATISVTAVADSTCVLDYTASGIGQLYVVVVVDGERPDSSKMIKLTASSIYNKQLFLTTSDELSGSLSVSGLEQNKSYRAYALPLNTDNVFGELASSEAFTTSDSYSPEKYTASPAASGTANKAADFEVTLTFEEPVLVNNADSIIFLYYDPLTGNMIPSIAESSASGKTITAKQTATPTPGQYVFLYIGNNAIKDPSGNLFAGVVSGIEGEYLVGLYYRIAYESAVETAISPESETLITDDAFKIELTYDMQMAFYADSAGGYDQTDIIVRYIGDGYTTDVEVPAANVEFSGTKVIITPPRTPVYGETITFMIAGVAFRVYGFSSPVAGIEFGTYSWLLSYGYERSLIIGSYTLSCTSAFNASTYTMDVTIAEDPDNADGVLITGLEGSASAVKGVFDGDFATVTMDVDQSLGDLLGDGSEVFLLDFAGTGEAIVASILSNGDMVASWGSYIVGGTYDGYWYDKYENSTWTKSTTKSSTTYKNYVQRIFEPTAKVK